MDVLVISQRKILPLTDGALIYSYGLIKLLKKIGANITLVSFTNGKPYSEEQVYQLKQYAEEIYLCKLSWKSIALNLSFKYPNNVRKYTRKAMVRLLEQIRQKRNFDLVVIDHLQMFEYANLFNNCKIVLHTHNVESDIWFEYASKCRGLVKVLVQRSARMTYEYEKKAIKQATYVTAISEADADKFRKMEPGISVEVLNGFSEYTLIKTEENIRNTNNSILFIGSYSWYPNATSAKYLVEEVMPVLRKKTLGVKLYLVGKEPTSDIIEYGKKYDDVIVTGMVDSVDPYIEHSDLFINAVCEGSGINIKMTEAMGKGIPIITSVFGARGYDIESGKEVLIYQTAEECAEYIEMLLADREMALRLRNNARAFYEKFNLPKESILRIFTT